MSPNRVFCLGFFFEARSGVIDGQLIGHDRAITPRYALEGAQRRSTTTASPKLGCRSFDGGRVRPIAAS